MSKPLIFGALALAMLCCAGCDKTRPDSPAPLAGAGAPAVAVITSSRPDPSVPSADSVAAPPATATAKDMAGAGPNGVMTRAQESSAMPMPGQVNNHSSTALDSAKSASAP